MASDTISLPGHGPSKTLSPSSIVAAAEKELEEFKAKVIQLEAALKQAKAALGREAEGNAVSLPSERCIENKGSVATDGFSKDQNDAFQTQESNHDSNANAFGVISVRSLFTPQAEPLTLQRLPQEEPVPFKTSRGLKKRSYDVSFKLEVVDFAEQNTNRGASRQFGIDEKSVRSWRKFKSELATLPNGKKRRSGGGKKPKLPDMEAVLVEWVKGEHAQGIKVTRGDIQRKALMLSSSKNFTASNGWLDNFIRRNSITLMGSQRRVP